MRIVGIDPGEKKIGVAISDATGMIANPLTIIEHTSRVLDAASIATLAAENSAGLIIVGQSLDEEGQPNPAGRRATRLAAAIRTQTQIPVLLWDEYGSTQAAKQAKINLGVTRKKRAGHLDDLAAAVILQDYLDHAGETSGHKSQHLDQSP
jgi:putative Holliday junction resolvase